MSFDLLSTVEYGGCSAKLSPAQLAEALAKLPKVSHPDLLVDIETHDDAGVYRLSESVALVQTTDFFTPICSDPYEFGRIAAANALSDVYAMGGKPLTALNLAMFPSERIPLDVLERILRGGMDTVQQAGAVIVGGHTIDDYPPKYGLAVTGTVHPDRLITNSGACPGEFLILTKPIGSGVLVAGRRIGEAAEEHYRAALEGMMFLNDHGAEVMQRYGVRGATDITGFGLLGHAAKLALAGKVSLEIESSSVPLLDGAYALADLGCIPGAAFRNQSFAETYCGFAASLDYNRRMLMLDAQTSGGLLMAVPQDVAGDALAELRAEGHPHAAIIGVVSEYDGTYVHVL
jgi:selenide, water dikinase